MNSLNIVPLFSSENLECLGGEQIRF